MHMLIDIACGHIINRSTKTCLETTYTKLQWSSENGGREGRMDKTLQLQFYWQRYETNNGNVSNF